MRLFRLPLSAFSLSLALLAASSALAQQTTVLYDTADNTLKRPTAAQLRTANDLAQASTTQPLSSNLTSWAAVARAAGVDTFLATPTSANLAALITNETGTGNLVFSDSPTLSAPVLSGNYTLTGNGTQSFGSQLTLTGPTVTGGASDAGFSSPLRWGTGNRFGLYGGFTNFSGITDNIGGIAYNYAEAAGDVKFGLQLESRYLGTSEFIWFWNPPTNPAGSGGTGLRPLQINVDWGPSYGGTTAGETIFAFMGDEYDFYARVTGLGTPPVSWDMRTAGAATFRFSGRLQSDHLWLSAVSSNPATPANGNALFSDSGNRLSWRNSSGFITTINNVSANTTLTIPNSGSVVVDPATSLTLSSNITIANANAALLTLNHISGNNPSLNFRENSTATASIQTFAQDLYIQTSNAKDIIFRRSGGTESARLRASDGALVSTGAVLSTSTSGGLGYATGAGGTVTQATSKSTGVTLNRPTGLITMNAAALAAGTSVAFTLTNSTIAATDLVFAHVVSGGTSSSYFVQTESVSAGSCTIHVRNISAGSLSEALVIRFAVLKSASS